MDYSEIKARMLAEIAAGSVLKSSRSWGAARPTPVPIPQRNSMPRLAKDMYQKKGVPLPSVTPKKAGGCCGGSKTVVQTVAKRTATKVIVPTPPAG